MTEWQCTVNKYNINLIKRTVSVPVGELRVENKWKQPYFSEEGHLKYQIKGHEVQKNVHGNICHWPYSATLWVKIMIFRSSYYFQYMDKIMLSITAGLKKQQNPLLQQFLLFPCFILPAWLFSALFVMQWAIGWCLCSGLILKIIFTWFKSIRYC